MQTLVIADVDKQKPKVCEGGKGPTGGDVSARLSSDCVGVVSFPGQEFVWLSALEEFIEYRVGQLIISVHCFLQAELRG